jgi:hypothetical protein
MFNLIRSALRWTRANPDRPVTINGVCVIYTRPDPGTCGWQLRGATGCNDEHFIADDGSTEPEAHNWLTDAIEATIL